MISLEAQRLAYVLSMPRSGSTLLSLMLGSHPEICCPPEPWIALALAEYLDLGGIRETPYGREWAEIAAIEFLLSPERKQRGVLGKAFLAIEQTPHLNVVAAAKQILEVAYQLHLDAAQKSIFIDKTPRYYAALELLDEILPRAKKIVLLRNPLDVFASYKSTWEIHPSIFTPEGVLVHTRDFCEGLFTLANCATTANRDVLVLRYENLVCDPERVLRSACEFVGTNFSSMMMRFHENNALIEEYRRSPVGDPVSSRQPKPANSQTVDAWRQRLDKSEIQALIDVLGANIFYRLGYQDSIVKLREMSISIPSEEQASERRCLLMQALVTRVHEPPFSAWNSFVSPLKDSQSDRAARLDAIQQLQLQLGALEQRFADAEADRAARLDVIQQQQMALDELGHRFAVSEADRAARLDAIQQQQASLDELGQRLVDAETESAARLETTQQQLVALSDLQQSFTISETDRAARLSLIRQQQIDLDELGLRLAASEIARATQLEIIQHQQLGMGNLKQSLAAFESEQAAHLEVIHRQQRELEQLRSYRGFLRHQIVKLKNRIHQRVKK